MKTINAPAAGLLMLIIGLYGQSHVLAQVGTTSSYKEELQWYEKVVDLSRAAGKECPEPPPIPTLSLTPPHVLRSDAFKAELESWSRDIQAIRKKKCPEDPVPPIPTLSENPERLRVKWEDFRTDLEKLRADVAKGQKDSSLLKKSDEIYLEGLDLYRDGINDYRVFARGVNKKGD